jgi:hypothetical protein
MSRKPFEVNVSSARGAPTGRRSDNLSGLVNLERVPASDGGDYDPGGAYWGGIDSNPLWCAWNVEGAAYVRAANREAAKREFPDCTFREPGHWAGFVRAFVAGYLECALWSSMGDDGEPLDYDYSEDDVHSDARAEMTRECVDFIRANRADLAGMNAGQAGHDFWLTRNGHGAGFWDRGLGDKGKRLSEASKVYGDYGLYVGDDSKLHGG